MIPFKRCAAAPFVLFAAVSCSQPSTAPKTGADATAGAFVYAPTLDKPYHQTMRRYEEMSIPGTPMRDAQEWTLDFDVVTTKETNLFKQSMKLVGLKISSNGAPLLRGDEVKSSAATVDILTDKDSNVVDVRGTDQLSEAIAGLGDPHAAVVLRQVFSPARLKALVVVRTTELHSDLIGRPAQAGSQWLVNDPDGGSTKTLKVVAQAPCGASQCAQVVRTYDVDKNALYADVADRVAAYVHEQGGDPRAVKLVGVDVKLEDSLLVAPSSMDYYGAKFDEAATIHVAGPNGELPVAFKLQRQSDYKY